MQAGQHLAGHGHGAPPFPMPPHPPGLQPPLPVSSAASLLAFPGSSLGPSHHLSKEDKGKTSCIKMVWSIGYFLIARADEDSATS